MATGALLERNRELDAIAGLLDGVAEGEGGLLLIEGEAGAGKTALLGVVEQEGSEREMLVLRARGGEFERDFPYGVVRQLFEQLLGERSSRAQLLSGSAALAAPVFEPEAAVDGDPFAIEHGLYWLVADLAASRPLALLVDDAQWADHASLRALAYIARRLEGLAVALAMTVRLGEPDQPAALLDEIRHEPLAQLIEPAPLSAQAVAALVAGEIGQASTDSFARTCFEASAGNPFLLTQLLRALDGGAGADGLDAEQITRLAAGGVARSLLARLARLGEHSTAVARAIAVLEPNAEARLVAALTGLPSAVVVEESERMIEARLLADARPLAFVHPLVRTAVLADVRDPRRAAAHSAAARLLHEDGAAADAVASHLMLAAPGGDPWVVRELRSAAAAALARGAPGATVRYLRRALREPPESEERLAVSRELGIALLRANDPEGIDVLRGVRSSLEDPLERARIVTELALSMNLRGRGDEGVALLEESLAELPDPDGGFATLLRGHMLMLIFWGAERRPDKSLLRLGEGLDADTQEGRLCLQVLALLGALGLGPVEPARQIAARLAADPAALAADALAGLAPQGVIITLALSDRRDVVDRIFDGVLEAVIRRGAMPGIGGTYGIRAYVHYLDGELREAQADAEIAVQIVGDLSMPVPIATWLSALLRCLTARGEYAAAEALLVDVWGGRDVVPGFPGAIFLCARGELRLETGRAAEARHDFLAASSRIDWLELANPESLGWRTGLACCEAALGNRDEALGLAAAAVERARRAGGERGIGVALRVQGEVAGGAEGVELLREAVDLLGGTRARLHHARALAALGAALRRANRRKEARPPLREALELAHRCGAVPLEEAVRTELAAAGARPRKAVFTGVDSLTPSELRVARMAAEGMTNREIAQALTVTQKTVETHLRHVFQKLEIDGRAALVGALAAGSS